VTLQQPLPSDPIRTGQRPSRLRVLLRAACFALVLVVPSLGAVQHSPLGVVGAIVYLVIGSAFSAAFYLWGHRLFPNLSQNAARWCAAITIVLVSVCSIVAVPLANASKLPGASVRDETIDLGVRELLHGRYPYYVSVSQRELMTNLPGSLFLATPFTLLGRGSYQNYFWVAICFFMLAAFFRDARMTLLLLWGMPLGSPVIIHELVGGSDMLANAIYILAAVIGVVYYARLTRWQKVALAVFSGLAFSSRPNFLLLAPLIFSYQLQNAGWKEALRYSLVVAVVFCAVTLPFWLYDPSGFSPLHVTRFVDCFDPIIPHSLLLICGTWAAVAVAVSLLRLGNHPLRLLWGCALIQAVPTAFGIPLASILAGRFEVAQYSNFGLSFLFFAAVALWRYRIAETKLSGGKAGDRGPFLRANPSPALL